MGHDRGRSTLNGEMTMTTFTINGEEYPSAGEALQGLDADGWEKAITIGGKYLATTAAEVERLAAAKVPFAILHDLHGRLVTVPVN
jgi:hypothetical protein